MNYDAIEQKSLALHLEERGDLGLLLLDSLDGLSDEEIDGGKAETAIQQAENLKKMGELSARIDPKLAQAALSLPVKERDQLATVLIHSLDEGIPGEVVTGEEWDEAWRIEIERRIKQLDRGEASTIPWEEVKGKERELSGEL